MAQLYQTGLKTHIANDIALSVSNDGAVHKQFRLPGNKSVDHIRVVFNACLIYARAQYHKEATARDIVDAIDYVYRQWTER